VGGVEGWRGGLKINNARAESEPTESAGAQRPENQLGN